MLHCMQALQVTPITPVLAERSPDNEDVEQAISTLRNLSVLYPAIQRVILPLGDCIPSTPAGAREELIQVSKPFSLPLHPHPFNSSPIHAGTPNLLQYWFPLYTPGRCTR